MKHELPKLAYSLESLNPVIGEKTMMFHYGKHHQTYVDNLNKLIEGTDYEDADIETIIKKAEGGIFNNGAQVWNHTFYFDSFSPNPKEKPEGKLLDKITQSFGSFDEFKNQFTKAAVTLFGSGWAWLVIDHSKSLQILQTSNAGNPIRDGFYPLLTCDVWEHAYYLDYQNRRADYVNNFWKIVDWQIIEKRLLQY